jgi:lipoprotein signal peptidase
MAIFDKNGGCVAIDYRPEARKPHPDHFLVKNLNVLAFGTIENGRSFLFSTKIGVVWPFIIGQRLVHLTPHMFPCNRSHSWISGGDHFLVKNPLELAFGIIENGRSWLFSTKMRVVWPFIIDQRLVHLTPHMFPCHRSHSWISGGDHFLVKNPYGLAFAIIENGHSWLFSTKMRIVWPLIIDQRPVNLTPHMFPCHRSHSLISGGDHFLVKNPNVLAFGTIENDRSWLFSTKMGVVWPVVIRL